MADSAEGNIVVNELLCYVQNNHKNHPTALVGVAIVGFYREEEVSAAKRMLFKFTETLNVKPDGTPRLIKRTPGDSKKKLECDDLLALYSVLDGAKVKLPTYVAANLQRVPSVNPGEVDVFALASNVASLTNQLDSMTKKIATMGVLVDDARSLRDDFDSVSTRLGALESRSAGAVSQADDDALGMSNRPQTTTSDTVQPASDNSSGWLTVARSKPAVSPRARARQPPPAVRVKGASTNSVLKSVPREDVLSAFVGRLHPNTSAEELGNHLTNIGIKGVVCRKLEAKDGRKFNTAAFRVTCCSESTDLFYDERSWPTGVELRDWVYYNK